MKKIIEYGKGIILFSLPYVFGILMFVLLFVSIYNLDFSKDDKLKLTQACEKGCVWAYGYGYNDSFLDAPEEVNDKIFMCIFNCNNVYFYGDNEKYITFIEDDFVSVNTTINGIDTSEFEEGEELFLNENGNITSCEEYLKNIDINLSIDCNESIGGADLLVGDEELAINDSTGRLFVISNEKPEPRVIT